MKRHKCKILKAVNNKKGLTYGQEKGSNEYCRSCDCHFVAVISKKRTRRKAKKEIIDSNE